MLCYSGVEDMVVSGPGVNTRGDLPPFDPEIPYLSPEGVNNASLQHKTQGPRVTGNQAQRGASFLIHSLSTVDI
jgi:hypothetical protein